jgi:hypothetical protein
LSSRCGTAEFDAGIALLDQIGLLDHHHRIGAPRYHAASSDGGGGAGRDLERRGIAAGNYFGVQSQYLGIAIAGANRIGSAHGETVHIRAIKRRRIDGRHDVMRKHASQRVGDYDTFRR